MPTTNIGSSTPDATTCSGVNACFGNILEAGQQIDDSNWWKLNNHNYDYQRATPNISRWHYAPSNGTFLCYAGSC